MNQHRVVEGCGPVDLFLAKQRYKIACRQIKSAGGNGRILDIGCGGEPLFLRSVDFTEKYGLDKNIVSDGSERLTENGITLINYNIDKEKLPFGENYFDVVSMLAVYEHIEPQNLVSVHRDIYRILKPNGMYIMTTPAFWTAGLLTFLANARIISDAPIREHKGSYKYSDVSPVLEQAGFRKHKFNHGYFEFFMNMWVTGRK
jgi:2-polyprenyl-3-methyl-5-hydroxy-6-metoxy-1,4-benzoquinol methylase